MDQARSRWEGKMLLTCGAGLDFVERRKLGGAHYLEDMRYNFVRRDVAVVLEELAGLWTDGLEVGLVPLHIFVSRFDLRVDLWCGHAREEEGRGARGGINNILPPIEFGRL